MRNDNELKKGKKGKWKSTTLEKGGIYKSQKRGIINHKWNLMEKPSS